MISFSRVFIFACVLRASIGCHIYKRDGAAIEYGYNGLNGPSHWHELAPSCQGSIQSPINIEPQSPEFEQIQGVLKNYGQYPGIDYPASVGTLEHVGDTLKFIPKTANGIFERPDGSYSLIQWHVHTPSDHRVNGIDYPAEIHFVHKRGDALAVIGAFVDFSTASSPFISKMVQAGRMMSKNETLEFVSDYREVVVGLRRSQQMYRYAGSLTTPPCSEGIKWLVASDVVLTITPDDFKALKQSIRYSARGTQPLFMPGDTMWQVKRKSDYYTEVREGGSRRKLASERGTLVSFDEYK